MSGSNVTRATAATPVAELGGPEPVIQESNRRLRDDEILLARRFTEGRSSIRVRFVFTPVGLPILDGEPVAEQAWSELRYEAFSYVLPAPP